MKILLRWLALAVAVTVLGVDARADERVTVQLRDGKRIVGNLDALVNGLIYVRVSQAEQPKIPIGEIAVIDAVGGASGLPETELREARGPEHFLLLKGGEAHKGTLIGIHGGEGSANPDQPRTYEFRLTSGEVRRFEGARFGRLYTGRYPFETTVAAAPAPAQNVPPGSVRVPASAGWVQTGLRVRRGDRIALVSTGEVQLSDNAADRAGSAGASRKAPNAPLPEAGAGALIGRIGPTGRPFAIGNQTLVPMPEDGLLFLAVNDDERSDNLGEFIVAVSPAGRTRP